MKIINAFKELFNEEISIQRPVKNKWGHWEIVLHFSEIDSWLEALKREIKETKNETSENWDIFYTFRFYSDEIIWNNYKIIDKNGLEYRITRIKKIFNQEWKFDHYFSEAIKLK